MIRVWLRALRRHGLRGSLRLIPQNLRAVLHARTPSARRAFADLQAFDREFGIDTAITVSVSRLHAAPESLAHAKQYQTGSVEGIRQLLDLLPIDHRRFTFVDIGSGKGRVLLIASLLPFRRIVGVEFDAALCQIAAANVARFRPKHRRCEDVQVRHADATTFIPPDGPLVVYLYNPFDAVMLAKVIEHLREPLQRHAGSGWIVYVQPDHREVLDAAAFLSLECSEANALFYRAVAPASGA